MKGRIKESNTVVNVVIPRELKARADAQRSQTGIPFNEMARRALNAWLEQQQKAKEPA